MQLSTFALAWLGAIALWALSVVAVAGWLTRHLAARPPSAERQAPARRVA